MKLHRLVASHFTFMFVPVHAELLNSALAVRQYMCSNSANVLYALFLVLPAVLDVKANSVVFVVGPFHKCVDRHAIKVAQLFCCESPK